MCVSIKCDSLYSDEMWQKCFMREVGGAQFTFYKNKVIWT